MTEVNCGCLSQRCEWLSLATQTKSAKVHLSTWELFLALVAVCNKTSISPKPDNPVNWGRMNLETTHYWRQNHRDLTWWNLKLKTLATMGTPRKINAILLNIKTNRPKLVSMCRYKLVTYWQNFTEIYLTWVKILQKVLGGGATFFDSHCICSFQKSYGKFILKFVNNSGLRAADVWTSVMKASESPAMTCSHRGMSFMMATLQRQKHQHLCYSALLPHRHVQQPASRPYRAICKKWCTGLRRGHSHKFTVGRQPVGSGERIKSYNMVQGQSPLGLVVCFQLPKPCACGLLRNISNNTKQISGYFCVL